jgi:hypothetical protein
MAELLKRVHLILPALLKKRTSPCCIARLNAKTNQIPKSPKLPYTSIRAMKGEVDQLHKKISLGLRHGFSELRPRLTLSHPPTFGIFGSCYDDCAAI